MTGRARGRAAIALLTLGVSFVCSVSAQFRMDALRGDELPEELLYLPNDRLMNHFTGGMSSAIADMLWIRCAQYTGKHFKTDRKFDWLNYMCDVTTRLDPYFVGAYRYGGMFLAALRADDDASLDLLHRGMIANPDAWELPYEAAVTWLLNRRDSTESKQQAAQYLAMAVETRRAPPHVAEFAANIVSKQDLVEVERTLWESTIASDNAFMRDLAKRKLQEVTLREACIVLNKAADIFEQRQGRRPNSVAELAAAGLIRNLPQDPLGGRFFIDARGIAQSSTILDEQTERHRNLIQSVVRIFRNRKGHWPQTLQETFEKHVASEPLPAHPYADREWTYDPATGAVGERRTPASQ